MAHVYQKAPTLSSRGRSIPPTRRPVIGVGPRLRESAPSSPVVQADRATHPMRDYY
ncbi:hypothetical protein HS041_23110 [Planomonospora sp. ID67723]|uniref:hypothetical protein n=1 Tax=Planomonospora sp. ID67723 TaxID=2738134 RepID=UPI0018C42969|nr:hypothetical protein [Planomonospora sp. ID67723]MBG0830656.1 hypothetical protein [Planomonospora sp. ID67723]